MRTAVASVLALGTLVVPGGTGAREMPPTRPGPEGAGRGKAPAPSDAHLAQVLREWERATQADREFRYIFTLTRRDLVFGKAAEVGTGEVCVWRPDRVRLEMRDAARKPVKIFLQANGQSRVYDFKAKSLNSVRWGGAVETPASRPGSLKVRPDDPTGWFSQFSWPFLGFPMVELGKRFTLRLEKEDEHWTYIRLIPKERGWWLPDAEWQVVLARQGRWVRRVWLCDGGDEMTLDFTPPQKGPCPPHTWDPPFKYLPAGWTVSP
jgi:hypothetical protein